MTVTPATGDECSTSIRHNFAGATEPAEAVVEDTWTTESSEDYSPRVFFGRLEEAGQGSVLLLGTSALPGDVKEDGVYTYEWESFDQGTDSTSHASGYAYTLEYDTSAVVRVSGAFNNDTFVGKYSTSTSDFDQWGESDTWSDEAALTIGDFGVIPSSSYLVLTDGAGGESPVVNTRQSYDCDSAGCTLSAETACAYSYELTGQATDLTPDDRWAQSAGQVEGGS